jgi:hypothetical protein
LRQEEEVEDISDGGDRTLRRSWRRRRSMRRRRCTTKGRLGTTRMRWWG